MRLPTLRNKADAAGRLCAVALGFSIPVSVALDNILLTALALCWMLGGNWRDKFGVALGNPVALSAFALWAWLALGLLWGERDPGDGLHYLGKYTDLLFIPLLMWSMRDAVTRRHALFAFGCGCALTLVASYLLRLDILPPGPWLRGDAANPAVFKLHITHNILMAAAAFLFAVLMRDEPRPIVKRLLGTLAIAAVANLLFMVQGRTGYLVLAALLLLWLASVWQWKGIAAAIAAGTVLVAGAYALSPAFQSRIELAKAEYAAWQPGVAQPQTSSVGLRLEYYSLTGEIIRDHPLLGVGTGGFPRAYADRVGDSARIKTRNPHNEYLLVAAQTGIGGLFLLVHLWYRQWRLARRLAGVPERDLARGLVLTMVIGCLLNSLLIDHTEGLYFAWMSAVLFGGLQPARTA